MSNAEISAIGLFLDILGVLLLWRFGLPPDVRRDGAYVLIVEQADEEEKAKGARYDCMSRWAISLIVLGFAMQLIGTLLPSTAFGRTQAVQTECLAKTPADGAPTSK